jgi:hypothetical protein
MEKLGKLFGTEARVKIMRLFLFNPGLTYDTAIIIDRAKVSLKDAKRELALLEKTGLIRPQKFIKEITATESKGVKAIKVTKDSKGPELKKIRGWILNEHFMYLSQLQSLLINTLLIKEDEIVRRVSQLGKVRLIVVAGVFIQQWESRADILVVGDRLKENQLQAIVRKMESEIGRELSYAILETPDFQYRMSVYDRLVRDIFDYPHRVLLDKLGIKLGF